MRSVHWACNRTRAQNIERSPSQHLLIKLRPRQNGRHSAEYLFKCTFLIENVWILIKMSLKFVPKGPISNIPALVQIMGWRRPGDKPLPVPMLVSLLAHIWVTRPQCVNFLYTSMARPCFTNAVAPIFFAIRILMFESRFLGKVFIFTRGQFWPSGIVVACVCVCLSVNHQLVRAITHQPFKLESPNLDQRCKRPWLRSLLFLGAIDLDL